MGNIGNMNTDLIDRLRLTDRSSDRPLPGVTQTVAFSDCQTFKRKGIIEVFGVGGIDGKSERIAHVASAKNLIGYFVSG